MSIRAAIAPPFFQEQRNSGENRLTAEHQDMIELPRRSKEIEMDPSRLSDIRIPT
jgi:hypothetical protein